MADQDWNKVRIIKLPDPTRTLFPTSKFKIVMTAHGVGEVWRDGLRLEKVSAVSFSGAVGHFNRVIVEFDAKEVEIECEAVDG